MAGEHFESQSVSREEGNRILRSNRKNPLTIGRYDDEQFRLRIRDDGEGIYSRP
jgi:hypothetical protein